MRNKPAHAAQASRQKRRGPTIAVAVLLLAGLCVLAYPFVSDLLASREQIAAVASYQKNAAKLPTQQEKQMLQQAQAYNEQLSSGLLADPFSGHAEQMDKAYLQLLNLDDMMGSIKIPKIGVNLPIYHGTGEHTLTKGVGHLYGTSLPVGGQSTHAVLTGHRGLPSATLFTHLDQLELGDRFYIEILHETLAYQVDKIQVVTPDESDPLQIMPGKDYVTLLTCTPYGINSHRLLVRGTRVAIAPQQVKDELQTVMAKPGFWQQWWWLLLLAAAAVLLLALFLLRRRRKHEA